MNEKVNRVIHSSGFFITLMLLLVCTTLLVGTYAWFTWSSTENTSLTMTIGKLADVTFVSGNEINAGLTPVFNYIDGLSTTFSINNRDTSGASFEYKVKFNIDTIDSELISDDVKFVLVKDGMVVAEQGMVTAGASNGTSVDVYSGTMFAGTDSFVFYLYIDGNVENDPNMMGKTITGNIMVEAKQSTGTNLVEHISILYNNASKTEVDAADGITYNYATSVGLMNDRFGTSTISINDGNIRYYGASPNNYVDIGDKYEQDVTVSNWVGPFTEVGLPDAMMPTTTKECLEFLQCSVLVYGGLFDTEEDCEAQLPYLLEQYNFANEEEACSTTTIPAGTTKSLYRIIGLFKDVELADGTRKDLIKVIRDEPIGNYSWDQSDSTVNDGYGVNEWSQADLMKLLNPTYESETVGGSLYWNSASGTCYGYDYNNGEYTNIPCDFTNIGLSTSAQNNIELAKWNLGGWNTNQVFANQMYSYERLGNVIQNPGDGITRRTIWSGRVALPYPSDYGYAVDLGNCSSKLYGYDYCTGDNWMYPILTLNGTDSTWLLTPYSGSASGAWRVGSDGYVGSSIVNNGNEVSPVFYLDSELTVESGTGRSDDPYVLW